jgi:hypothetical protein
MKVLDFKQMVVEKTLDDLIKDIPQAHVLDGDKLLKLINGVLVKDDEAIPFHVSTKSFGECLFDTYLAVEHCISISCGIKISGKPVYGERLDWNNGYPAIMRKLSIEFVIPSEVDHEA